MKIFDQKNKNKMLEKNSDLINMRVGVPPVEGLNCNSVVVSSEIMGGENIVFYKEKKRRNGPPRDENGRLVYDGWEIERIAKLDLDPDSLKGIHLVKSIFNGRIVGIEDVEGNPIKVT